jgi:cytochrome c biogenesis protein ResB
MKASRSHSLLFKLLLPTLVICASAPTIALMTSCGSTTSNSNKKNLTATQYLELIDVIGKDSFDKKHNKDILCKGKGDFSSKESTDKELLKQVGKSTGKTYLSLLHN